MNRSIRIILIFFFVVISGIYILLQWAFGQVSCANHSVTNTNTIVAFESILLVLLICHLIYNGFKKESAIVYFSFLIANLLYMLAAYFENPVLSQNMGFHHAQYALVTNPLLINLGFYIAILLYLNASFREQKAISLRFSLILYALAITVIAASAAVKINADSEIQKSLLNHA